MKLTAFAKILRIYKFYKKKIPLKWFTFSQERGDCDSYKTTSTQFVNVTLLYIFSGIVNNKLKKIFKKLVIFYDRFSRLQIHAINTTYFHSMILFGLMTER